MAKFVIKKDGEKEPFDILKIETAIRAAATATDLPAEKVDLAVKQISTILVEFVNEKEEIPTAEIKGKILSELDVLEPSISEAWRKHEQEKETV